VAVVRYQQQGISGSHDRRTSTFLTEHARSFSGLTVVRGSPGLTLVSQTGSAYVSNLHVSADYFRVLSVRPALGRDFDQEDEDAASALMLSHDVWTRHFDASPDVLGRVVRLGGRPHTVVGVMPASFRSFPSVDVWLPFQFRTDPQGAGLNYLLVGRLASGRTQDEAEAELRTLTPVLNEQYPGAVRDFEQLGVVSYQWLLGRDLVPALVLLSVAVGVFLLTVCSNAAGLLLARAAARQREFAIRRALGASGGRLVCQLMTESLMLAVGGGLIGLLVAAWGMDGLVSL